jgi:hypothetical protein
MQIVPYYFIFFVFIATIKNVMFSSSSGDDDIQSYIVKLPSLGPLRLCGSIETPISPS